MPQVQQTPDRRQLILECKALAFHLTNRFGQVGYTGMPFERYSTMMLEQVRKDMIQFKLPSLSVQAISSDYLRRNPYGN